MKQIIAFGDSNTWGLNPVLKNRYPENVRWTGLLRKKLSRSGFALEGIGCHVIRQVFRAGVQDFIAEAEFSGFQSVHPCFAVHELGDLIPA